jgi:FkbM family methyltransferase
MGGVVVIEQRFARAVTLPQRARLALARSYVARELPGWGRVFRRLIGSYERDDYWAGAPTVRSRNKYFGFECDFDLSSWSGRQSHVLGRWIELPAQLMLHAIRANTILDIGANRGEFALAAAALKPDSKIISFEPNPKIVAILKEDIARNKMSNIEVRPYGLSDRNDTLSLHVPYDNSGAASFGGAENKAYVVDVPVCVGDEVLGDISPELIKIDVEGFEGRVVRGLEKLIDRSQPIIISEFCPVTLGRCGSSRDEFMSYMQSLGYRGFGMRTRRTGLKDFDLVLEGIDTDMAWLPRHIQPNEIKSSTRDLRRRQTAGFANCATAQR